MWLIVFMLCAPNDWMTDVAYFLGQPEIRSFVKEISRSINRNDPSRPIDTYLTKCKTSMETLIEQSFVNDSGKRLLRNRLIISLRDEIQRQVYQSNAPPNAQFDVAEKEFRRCSNLT